MAADAWYERVTTGWWRRVRRAAEAAGGTVGRAVPSRTLLLFAVTSGLAMGEAAALRAVGYVSALIVLAWPAGRPGPGCAACCSATWRSPPWR